jgi:hypothetical protein
MSGVKWQIGPVKLANGFDAVINRFCEKRKRYIGELQDTSGRWFAREWDANGWYCDLGRDKTAEDPFNLAPPPKKTVWINGWLNIYDDNSANFFDRREDADKEDGRSACIPFGITVTEGEGL